MRVRVPSFAVYSDALQPGDSVAVEEGVYARVLARPQEYERLRGARARAKGRAAAQHAAAAAADADAVE